MLRSGGLRLHPNLWVGSWGTRTNYVEIEFICSAATGHLVLGRGLAALGELNMVTTARITTVCQSGRLKSTVEANREYMLEVLERALQEKPDLVCLPEAFSDSGVQLPIGQTAEALSGATVEAVATRAR